MANEILSYVQTKHLVPPIETHDTATKQYVDDEVSRAYSLDRKYCKKVVYSDEFPENTMFNTDYGTIQQSTDVNVNDWLQNNLGLEEGDRIFLIRSEEISDNAVLNGIFEVTTLKGYPEDIGVGNVIHHKWKLQRPKDFAHGSTLDPNVQINISSGDQAHYIYQFTNTEPVIIDTDPLLFQQIYPPSTEHFYNKTCDVILTIDDLINAMSDIDSQLTFVENNTILRITADPGQLLSSKNYELQEGDIVFLYIFAHIPGYSIDNGINKLPGIYMLQTIIQTQYDFRIISDLDQPGSITTVKNIKTGCDPNYRGSAFVLVKDSDVTTRYRKYYQIGTDPIRYRLYEIPQPSLDNAIAGNLTEYDIVHNFTCMYPVVQIYGQNANTRVPIILNYTIKDANTITLDFSNLASVRQNHTELYIVITGFSYVYETKLYIDAPVS
jgi:hypothetical protein